MSGNSKEIPGFYRDPNTGKYYREGPGSSCNLALNKLKTEREVHEEYKIKPKVTNVIHYMNTREISNIDGVQGSKEYLKMRWHLKKHVKSTELDRLSMNLSFTSVEYIIGSKDSIYGFWMDERSRSCIIGTMKFNDHYDNDVYFHKAFGFVLDMCEGLNNDFVVAYNTACRNGLIVERVDEFDRWPLLQYGQVFAGRPLDYIQKQIFCCCCNKNNLCYAFGCENIIGFFDSNERDSYLRVNGRVHTVAFNDTGNLIVSGVHTGKLYFHDLRTKRIVMNVEVSKSCLLDSSVLNSHHVIVAGTGDVLCNVDIRKKEVVTEFFTHKQQGVKREPLSIANNMLCALGSDNRIRIWDLSGGLPIHKIAPLENPVNKIKGWLCAVDNTTYLYHFEGSTRNIFEVL